jgi:two-component system, sensor histidine kinase and response regulator
MKVMIVDDDEDLRESIADVFRDEGHDVWTARNGSEGHDLLKTKTPDVLILDLMMPVMSGNELYALMQKDARLSRVPVLISTSDPTRAPAGAPFVRKPIQMRRLIELVKQLNQSGK